MSKSYGNTIEIFAEGKALKTAVMSIVTDLTAVDAPKNPETCNVFAIYKLFATEEELAQLTKQYAQPLLNSEERSGRPFGYGDAKNKLLAKIDAYFAEARAKRKELAANPEAVEQVLRDGAARARLEVVKTMSLVRQAVGMAAQKV